MGSPFVMAKGEYGSGIEVFRQLAENVDKECDELEKSPEPPHTRYNTKSRYVIIREHSGLEKSIVSKDLRIHCQCAKCVDELSGFKVLKNESVDEEIFPHKIARKGNYAVAINWSDGHFSLYPYKYIMGDRVPGDVT